MCEIYIIISLSANLVSGYTGLLSFAYAAIYGLGAYVTTLVMKNFDLNYFPCLLVAIAFNVIVSFIITFFFYSIKRFILYPCNTCISSDSFFGTI